MFAPASITKLAELVPGNLRRIELTLPASLNLDGRQYPVQDGMRPGSAFSVKRADTHSTQLYFRSNCSITAQRAMETIITDTYDQSDSWSWWRTSGIKESDTVGIRMETDPRSTALKIHESKNLALEPDSWWLEQDFATIAFSTGIVPFLAHIRYMALFEFGRAFSRFGRGAHYVLIVSVKEPRQLICHEELMAVEDRFPENFRYHPALTREWADDWPYTRNRVVRMEKESGQIDISPLINVVPDIERRHVRACGGKAAIRQVVKGLQEHKLSPLSLKTEIN
jgi:hypothetical protein